MNIIGILCITLAINSWGKAMFHLDTFPTWANVTGLWAWLCLKRWSMHTHPFLTTGASKRPHGESGSTGRHGGPSMFGCCSDSSVRRLVFTDTWVLLMKEWRRCLKREITYFLFTFYIEKLMRWKRSLTARGEVDNKHTVTVFMPSDIRRLHSNLAATSNAIVKRRAVDEVKGIRNT